MKDDRDEQLEYGVIAQQVEEVIPAIVNTGDDEDQTKSVNYTGFIGWIIEAIKELSKKFNASESRQLASEKALKEELKEKDQKISELERRLERLEEMMQEKGGEK